MELSFGEVVWADGLHLGGTPLWCDATTKRQRCFVSHLRGVSSWNHDEVLASSDTLKIVDSQSWKGPKGRLALPFFQPFFMGDVRLQLIPSGDSPGASLLLAESGGLSLLYVSTLSESGELPHKKVDSMVINTNYLRLGKESALGSEETFSPVELENAVIWVDNVGQGLVYWRALSKQSQTVFTFRSLANAIRSVSKQSDVAVWNGQEDGTLLWKESLETSPNKRVPRELGLVLSQQRFCDFVDQCAPRTVVVFGRFGDVVETLLTKKGRQILRLGEHRQLSLFS